METITSPTKTDIMNVLKNHMKVTKVSLGKVTSCEDFWNHFRSDVYNSFRFPQDEYLLRAMKAMQAENDFELVSKQGRLLKRLAKRVKLAEGYQLTDSELGIIGDKLQYYLNKNQSTYYVDFIDQIDWKDGQFGHEDSCWWGCYSDSQEVFIDGGGWAIRFYEHDNDPSYDDGIGRTWIMPRDNYLLCFNSYGVERSNVSKVIKSIFKESGITLHYASTSIKNEPNTDIPYINGGTGFIMYPDGYEPRDYYDLNLNPNEGRSRCAYCDNWHDDEDMNYINDNSYCERCTDRYFRICDVCSEYVSRDDIHSTNDGYICDDCAESKGYQACDSCDDYYNDLTHEVDTERDLCEHCLSQSSYCETCQEYNSIPHNHDESDDNRLVRSRETIALYSGTYTINLFRVPSVKGLFVYDDQQTEGGGHRLVVVHENSGLIISNHELSKLRGMRDYLIELSKITDWTQDKDVIGAIDGLGHKVRLARILAVGS